MIVEHDERSKNEMQSAKLELIKKIINARLKNSEIKAVISKADEIIKKRDK